ncbi:hypothetical protein [Pacificoceanicola onchidii]|uniref:hypothetical protein n=1 Tax=Pacificoceanicola onchidii TaxID=2562685 RepID=UPI0010A2FE22|nr:hypothetical protein [Pacificoceanicola onchidii]
MSARVRDSFVLGVRPSRVPGYVGTKWPVAKGRIKRLEARWPKPLVNLIRPALKRQEPFVIPAEHFKEPVPVERTDRFRKIADFIGRDRQLEETFWFQDLCEDLRQTGIARHKTVEMRSEAEIVAFFRTYVQPLIASLRKDGFRPDKTGFESTAVIDADGRLAKSGSGNHRFVMSQVLDLPSFPLKIVAVHEDWFQREVLREGDTLAALKDALSRVEAAHQ